MGRHLQGHQQHDGIWDEWEAGIRKEEREVEEERARGEGDGDGTALYVRTGIRGDLEGADVDEFFISGNDYEPESRQDHSLSS